MPTDLELQVERANRLRSGSGYDKAIDRYAAARKARTDAEERRRLAEAEARNAAAMQAQQLAAQRNRDQQQQEFDLQQASHRGNIAANAAAMDNRYSTQRDQQQQKNLLKRDAVQQGFQTQRDRQQTIDQQQRDERQFGYSTQQDNQRFDQQLQRDEVQQRYSTERGDQQFGQQLQRDSMQNDFYSMRDQTQQGYTQQNMYQRQTADVQAKWNDQVQQAKAAGLDFSPRQQQKMKELDATFRKNVLNNQELDEGLKQQAMFLHQQALSAIVPEDKVVTPEQEIQQQFYEDPRMGMMRRTVTQHGAVWEPLGLGSNGQQQQDPAKIQAEQEKEAERIRKLTLDRHLKFNETLREIREEIDPTTLEKVYKDDDAVDAEALKRFAAQEEYYTGNKLQPHEMYQLQARKDQEKTQAEMLKQQRAEEKRLREMPKQDISMPFGGKPDPMMQTSPNDNPYRQKLEALQKTTGQSTPVPVSSTNIDTQLKQTLDSGDKESAAAMRAVKSITAKFKGLPPLGSPERQELEDAMRFLGAKGFKFAAEEKKAKPFDFQENLGGWQQ